MKNSLKAAKYAFQMLPERAGLAERYVENSRTTFQCCRYEGGQGAVPPLTTN